MNDLEGVKKALGNLAQAQLALVDGQSLLFVVITDILDLLYDDEMVSNGHRRDAVRHIMEKLGEGLDKIIEDGKERDSE